ncbi:GTP pyrophosphokinase [Candidatus Fokinia solitaria]|uniref:GTP pyrophosphokinase rsh n=1 Tax=Candidatus Fokinia solitaria TaxID=1802984 RepID=A0A2U8BSK6_9RICK|nr:RelA/SpoT family protein [Candidatus Fokinia solitaria]AWD33321.1 GTP pyrophosphokinase [Candidatus Fokinia solitaria]
MKHNGSEVSQVNNSTEVLVDEAVDKLLSMIRERFQNIDEDAVRKAVSVARNLHSGQTRSSGEPYVLHCIEVAIIVLQFNLNTKAVVAAVLHDVLEDSSVTFQELKTLFGEKEAELVDGLTKVKKDAYLDAAFRYSQSMKKFLLAAADDIIILLIKLADRLHNMRTLHFIRKSKKIERIARETLKIYVPLAEKLGIEWCKNELANLASSALDAALHKRVVQRLNSVKQKYLKDKDRILNILDEVMVKHGIKAVIVCREKDPYSVLCKIKEKGIPVESINQLHDILGFRILTNTVKECYLALFAVHATYTAIPGRIKDYISMPKSNGYQSLHTSIANVLEIPIEIQIRTFDMHKVAENGIAAHWRYKSGMGCVSDISKEWLLELDHALWRTDSPETIMEYVERSISPSAISCFSPAGKTVSLPEGATVLDFAFAIHSDVGLKCIKASVNSVEVPITHVLANGDSVHVFTGQQISAKLDWLNAVTTTKAVRKIRKYLKAQGKMSIIEVGKGQLLSVLKKHRIEYVVEFINVLMDSFHVMTRAELYYLVGCGKIRVSKLDKVVLSKKIFADMSATRKMPEKIRESRAIFDAKATITFPNCCNPLPLDEIIGIRRRDNVLEIHMKNCMRIMEDEETVNVKWSDIIKKVVLSISIIGEAEEALELIKLAFAMFGQCVNVEVYENSASFRINIRISEFQDSMLQHFIDSCKRKAGKAMKISSYVRIKSFSRL